MQPMKLLLHSTLIVFFLRMAEPQSSACQISGYAHRSSYVWQSQLLDQTSCVSDCLSGTKSITRSGRSDYKFMFDNMFNPKKQLVNCDISTRQFIPYCRYFLKASILAQAGTRRYFYAPEFNSTFFEAHKFCRRRGLTLGTTDVKSKELEIALLMKPAGTEKPLTKATDKKPDVIYWGDYRAQNAIYIKEKVAVCSGFKIEKEELIRVEENCSRKLNFFCDVPAFCYSEVCTAGTGFITKGTPSKLLPDNNCLAPQCLDRKACTANDLSVDPDGGIQKTFCGKSYLIVKTKVTQEQAMRYCCAKKLSLLKVESEEELNCVTDLLTDKDVGGKQIEFWTSATDKSCPGRFSWCSASISPVPKWIWDDNEPQKNSCAVAFVPILGETEFYAEVHLKTKDCSNQAFFICEEEVHPKFENPAKPCDHTCYSSNCTSKAVASMFNFRSSGPGLSGPIKSVCGYNYFVSRSKRSWQDSELSCCEDKMELATVNTHEEIECLRELFGILPPQDSLKGGPYWVGGTDLNCPLNFAWCSSFNKQPLTVRNMRTLKLNNRKSGSCVAIDLNPQKTGLVAFKCDQTYKYICKDARTCNPTCPEITACNNAGQIGKSRSRRNTDKADKADKDDEKDDDEEEKVGNKSGKGPSSKTTVIVSSTAGSTTSKSTSKPVAVEQTTGVFQSASLCGRTYLFSEDQLDVDDAMEQCCLKNMRLLSLDGRNEGDCIVDNFKNRPNLNLTTYWTSGTDSGCKNHHVWCSTGELFSALEMGKARMTMDKNKDCLLMEIDAKKKVFFLKDELCSLRQKFICEPVFA